MVQKLSRTARTGRANASGKKGRSPSGRTPMKQAKTRMGAGDSVLKAKGSMPRLPIGEGGDGGAPWADKPSTKGSSNTTEMQSNFMGDGTHGNRTPKMRDKVGGKTPKNMQK